jgi:hypothetical protein
VPVSIAHRWGYDPRIMPVDDHRDPAITVLKLTPWRLRTTAGSWRLTQPA